MLTLPFSLSTPSCDEQWGGLYCDEPETSLPVQLKDNFNRAPSSQNWLTVNGGKLSTVCGAVASGLALHFSGVRVGLKLLSSSPSESLLKLNRQIKMQ